ncbi:ATP-dependent Clp protease proteolytic subunit-related protein 4, chloroplastic [Cornus florida]|uniref:ATP-dependent Clp protease proteolytic subunit-related protein 4, chloroplastic n=1 Tax=Cornus florida TaxID=4283 RepID=UPI00289C7E49|nr:ATP-dependent Clp protease proteolytic subunit-related protein 4, chloroplastic [Cornus florida]
MNRTGTLSGSPLLLCPLPSPSSNRNFQHHFTLSLSAAMATVASHFFPTTRTRTTFPKRTVTSSSIRSSLSTNFLSPLVGGSVAGDLSGLKIRPPSLNPNLPSSGSHAKRGVVTMVIPFSRGSAWEQPPPDLASYLYKNRIVYLGMSLVPSVTELILAEFLYLQYEDEEKPIYLYVNSTGTTKGGEKLGYETEAFAIYDVMRYVKPPIFTLCVGNAWGEAALLLAAGSKGNRSALPSSTIMIKQPIARFQGQATDIELARKEVKNVKAELVKLYSKHIGKTPEQIEEDIRRPKYFSPSEAVEYGIIDKVLYNERSTEDRGVLSDLKKAQLI